MSDKEQPVLCIWDGEVMKPATPYWAQQADKLYVIGLRYMIEIQHERSTASHRQYFAAVNDTFTNLPDELAERFGSADALRKAALIATGFRDERSFVASSRAEALRLAAFVRPVDDYSVVSVSGATVVVLTAKSQSMRAMGRDEFQRSKDAVLNHLATLIGTTPDALMSNEAA